ncbi:MAG: hypothetical protein AB9856_13630 [Cellulosilyticaceae bacterium]
MRQKIIGASLLLIGVSISIVGCGLVIPKRESKIVLEEDVRDQLSKTKQSSVEVQVLDLKLKEKEFFTPSFYYQGQIYGSIDKGSGEIELEGPTNEYPVGGYMKEYLYTIAEDGVMTKSNKKIIINPSDIKIIGKEFWGKSSPIYRVDYAKEDEPHKDENLIRIVKSVGLPDNIGVSEHYIDDKTNYVIITNYSLLPKGYKVYFYDLNKKKLYKNKENGIKDSPVTYIPKLKSFVHLDDNLKLYKAIFKEDTYEFEEYIDFNQFIHQEEKIDYINIYLINDSQIVIMEEKEIEEINQDNYETKRVSLFDFKTNEFKKIFEAGSNQHISIGFEDEVVGQEGIIFFIDEFKIKDGYIHPLKRTFKSFEKNELVTLYDEDIQEEGPTVTTGVYCKSNDKSGEIFIIRDINTMENNVETTKRRIYKRYKFQSAIKK